MKPSVAETFNDNRPNLVLDLDETLVYTTRIKTKEPCEEIYAGNQEILSSHKTRPFGFYEKVSKLYNVFIFTAAQKEYADAIIDKIAPFVSKDNRFYKKSITNHKGFAVKDLNIIHIPVEKTIMIDDAPGSGIFQPFNQIIISPWHGENDDNVIHDQLLPLVTNIIGSRNILKAVFDDVMYSGYKNITLWSIMIKKSGVI